MVKPLGNLVLGGCHERSFSVGFPSYMWGLFPKADQCADKESFSEPCFLHALARSVVKARPASEKDAGDAAATARHRDRAQDFLNGGSGWFAVRGFR